MKRLNIALFSVLLVSGCGEDSKEELTCTPVILPAVTVKLVDTNQDPLDICDTILTIDSASWNETIYGSAENNCSNVSSLSYGDDLTEHNLLVEKAGFISQRFELINPEATSCGYDTLNLNVVLVAN